MESCCDEACDMGHIDHEERAYFVSDLSERFEIDRSRISGSACNDELRLVLFGFCSDVIIVDRLVFAEPVSNEVV